MEGARLECQLIILTLRLHQVGCNIFLFGMPHEKAHAYGSMAIVKTPGMAAADFINLRAIPIVMPLIDYVHCPGGQGTRGTSVQPEPYAIAIMLAISIGTASSESNGACSAQALVKLGFLGHRPDHDVQKLLLIHPQLSPFKILEFEGADLGEACSSCQNL